jgi:ankyrin repeat protein
MSQSPLPERPSLEYLKKLAKDRLRTLRRTNPQVKLAAALLDVAREHGFHSWRALKAHVEQHHTEPVERLVIACRNGDPAAVRQLVVADPNLPRARDSRGSTGLHAAAGRGHVDVVRFLLEHGADPDARDAGDNAAPLHFAAGGGYLDTVRALLDAGADVHGHGDLHETDVIGWATAIGRPDTLRPDVVSLLVERGARHHVFSAIAVGDLDLIRRVIEGDPDTLDRRMSRFEHGQTALHFAISRQRYDILDLLIECGADLEARDVSGRTALEAALMHGDREAARRLRDAGALPPPTAAASDFTARMNGLAGSVSKGTPMITVPDVARALDWYVSIGFKETARYEDGGVVNFGLVSFGRAELMLNMHGRPAPHDVSLWFYTDQVDAVYEVLKSRQLHAASTEAAADQIRIEFQQDIEDMFYGARQFCVRDLNGYELYFIGDRPAQNQV